MDSRFVTGVVAVGLVIFGIASASGEGWKEVRSDEGRYCLYFPAEPQKQATSADGQQPRTESLRATADGRSFYFRVTYFTQPVTKGEDAEKLFDRTRDRWIKKCDGTLSSETWLARGRNPGRHCVYQTPAKLYAALRLCLVGDRLYELNAQPTREHPDDDPDFRRFFHSFWTGDGAEWAAQGARPPIARPAWIRLVAPPTGDGPPSFTLGGQPFQLAAGQSQEVEQLCTIVFDRGHSRGDARYALAGGVYTFRRRDDGSWDLSRSGNYSEASSTTASGGQGESKQADSRKPAARERWIAFRCEEERFVAYFPGEPKKETVGSGSQKTQSFSVTSASGWVLQVRVFPLAKQAGDGSADVERILDRLCKVPANLKATNVTSRKISIGKHQGREIICQVLVGEFKAPSIDRTYLVDDRVYQVRALALPGQTPDGNDLLRFLRSFWSGTPAEWAAAGANPPITRPARIRLLNSPSNSGPVSYSLNGRAYKIAPGQTHELLQTYTIAFDRGASAGNARYALQDGVYRFTNRKDGSWELLRRGDYPSIALPVVAAATPRSTEKPARAPAQPAVSSEPASPSTAEEKEFQRLDTAGWQQYMADNYVEMERTAQKMKALAEGPLKHQPARLAFATNYLAMAAKGQGRYAEAEPLYKQSLALREKTFGPESLQAATCLANLAALYTAMHQYHKAEPLLQQSLKIRESKLGPDHLDVVGSLRSLATLYEASGECSRAEPLCQRILQIRESKLGPDHLDVAGSLNSLAMVYRATNQYAKAEPLYHRSLKIHEARLGPDHPDVAVILNNLANLYMGMAQYAQVERYFQRCLKILESKHGADSPEVATGLNNLALFHEDMGQYAKAGPLLERSLKIRQSKLGPDCLDVADSLNNLANLYLLVGEYDRAKSRYRRALQIKQSKLGPEHPQVAQSLHGLALLCMSMGEYDEAEPLHRRALQIRQSKLGPEHLEVAASLQCLANLSKTRGQYGEAEKLYQRSLMIYESKLGCNHPDVAQFCLYNLALFHAETGRWTEAGVETDRERRIVRRHVARTLPILSEKEQLTFLHWRDKVNFHTALSLGLHQRSDAEICMRSAGWVLNGKAVAQEVLAQRVILAAESRDPTLANLVRQLHSVRTQLTRLSLAGSKNGQEAVHREQVDKLSLQEQELSRQLSQAGARSAAADPWVEPLAVRKALGKDALLIEIVRFRVSTFKVKKDEPRSLPPHYVAWLIPAEGQGAISIVDLGEAKPIDEAVQCARTAFEKAKDTIDDSGEVTAEKQVREAMRELTSLVFQPLEQHFGHARELVVSPDAALWLVPWGALPLPGGRYAVEKYQIRYVPSGRDLVGQATTKSLSLEKPVMFANPDYDLGPGEAHAATRAVLRGVASAERVASTRGLVSLGDLKRVERLPGTAEEAEAIKPSIARYAGAEPVLYQDQNALEGVFKAVQRPRLMVLSTHGFFLSDQEVEPGNGQGAGQAAEQVSPGRAASTVQGKPLDNPLLRCGLMLAGCNKREEETAEGMDDGILTGLEIVGTDLRGTELVVLSACETGLGQVRNGEGVAGLRQAFQLAGAKAVVSTLWQVPDQETMELMNGLFGYLSLGKSKAEALRAAQLSQIQARREGHSAAHPYYWAAFTLTGE